MLSRSRSVAVPVVRGVVVVVLEAIGAEPVAAPLSMS
jgi:hypothetical protein